MARAVRAIGPARLGFLVCAWLFVLCLMIQVFLVGLDIFADVSASVHRDFAYLYGWLAPIMVLLAAAARAPARTRSLTIVLLVLFAVETFLPTLRAELPVLAALHTVNALVIFGLAIVVAQRATDWVRARPPATVGP